MTVTEDILTLTKTETHHLSFLDSSLLCSLDAFQVDYSYVGTIDHAALAILVRGQRAPCKCRTQLRAEQLPRKLSALARLEKHEKRKENLPSAHLTHSSKQNL